MATNINRTIVTGNLTRDPELRSTSGGTSVCSMRIAVNTSAKINGEWTTKPNYFNVTAWGAQGENCARYLTKGRGVAVDGRLSWREYTDKDGNKRESIEIVADTVQFLGGGEGGGQGNGGGFTDRAPTDTAAPASVSGGQADLGGFGATGSAGGAIDDDIPFLFDTVSSWHEVKTTQYSPFG